MRNDNPGSRYLATLKQISECNLSNNAGSNSIFRIAICWLSKARNSLSLMFFWCHSIEKRYRIFSRISDIQYPPLGVAANINRYGWILNNELPKMGASPQTPKLRGAARHYAVHQVEPHIPLDQKNKR